MPAFSKTVEALDYHTLIPVEVADLYRASARYGRKGMVLEIGHPHRYWEYGIALAALRYAAASRRILEVGPGRSFLSPMLVESSHDVTDYEPDVGMFAQRESNRQILGQPDNWHLVNAGLAELESLPPAGFDAVFCISVLEHVDPGYEVAKAWNVLARQVAPGGVLVITVDVVPDKSRSYVFDNLRRQNFNVFDVGARAGSLATLYGFEFIGGEADFTYHGDEVFNYSFCSVAMKRPGR